MVYKYCKMCGQPCNVTANVCSKCGHPFYTNQSYVKKYPMEDTNGFGIAGFVIGIVSLCLSCIAVGIFTGIVGFIFSLIGMRSIYKHKGLAIAGLVLNILAIFLLPFCFSYYSNLNEAKNENIVITEKKNPSPAPITKNDDIKEEVIEDDGIINTECNGCTLKYLRHEIKKNYADEDCLVVYYEFTNNSKEATSFLYTFSAQAFQNGIELDISYFLMDDEEDNRVKYIKPGKSIEVFSLFIPKDNSVVDLEIDELISFDNKKLDTMQLSLE